MVTARTQRQRIKAEKKEAAAAEAKVAAEVDKAKRRARAKEAAVTAEQITEERDGKGLSWAQVAANLDLGSPGAARRIYTQLTGRPHTESVMTGRRATRGTGARSTGRKLHHPHWHDESDQDEIINALQKEWIPAKGDGKDYVPGHYQGSTIVVERKGYNGTTFAEEVQVARVHKLAFEGPKEHLVVHLGDRTSGAFRAFLVSEIVSVS